MRFVRLGLFASLVSLCLGSAALAQALALSPSSGHPNLAVKLSGTGFADSEAVDLYVDTTDTLLLVSSSTGVLAGSVTMPAGAQPGTHYITAVGRRSGDAVQTAFTVTTAWPEAGFGAAHLAWNPYENTLSTANVASLSPLWDATTNSFGATPYVGSGRVIIANQAGVQSLSLLSGASYWSVLTNQSFYASPALSGNTLYIGGSTANFYALNASTGATVWTTGVGSSVIGSATVAAGNVYFGCEDNKVYALKASTGAVLWTYTTGAYIDSTPAYVNGVVYIGSTDDKLYALNATTGALLWSYTTGGAVESSPAVVNGIVYFGSDDDNIYAVRAKGPGIGTLLWKTATGSAVYQSPAFANGTAYVGSADGNMYALNGRTGAIKWQFATNGILGSAAVANGVVYFTSRDGTFSAVDAVAGTVAFTAETGATFFGSPVVSDGVLYLSTSGGDTYAFSLLAGVNALPIHRGPPAISTLRPDPKLAITPTN